jgi:hypothetical protein
MNILFMMSPITVNFFGIMIIHELMNWRPSCNFKHNYGKSQLLVGKSTNFSWATFNSFLYVYQRVHLHVPPCSLAIENGQLYLICPLKFGIFSSYVGLPEGTLTNWCQCFHRRRSGCHYPGGLGLSHGSGPVRRELGMKRLKKAMKNGDFTMKHRGM